VCIYQALAQQRSEQHDSTLVGSSLVKELLSCQHRWHATQGVQSGREVGCSSFAACSQGGTMRAGEHPAERQVRVAHVVMDLRHTIIA